MLTSLPRWMVSASQVCTTSATSPSCSRHDILLLPTYNLRDHFLSSLTRCSPSSPICPTDRPPCKSTSAFLSLSLPTAPQVCGTGRDHEVSTFGLRRTKSHIESRVHHVTSRPDRLNIGRHNFMGPVLSKNCQGTQTHRANALANHHNFPHEATRRLRLVVMGHKACRTCSVKMIGSHWTPILT